MEIGNISKFMNYGIKYGWEYTTVQIFQGFGPALLL